jgi:two-component system, cell cycle response regulator
MNHASSPSTDLALELLELIDIEALQEKLLQVFGTATQSQSAALWISGERVGMRLRAWRGFVDKSKVPEVIDPSLVQSHAWESDKTLLVPLITNGGELCGLIQLGDCAQPFDETVLRECNRLSVYAAAALKSAVRFAHLQRLGLRDKETGAYTLSYFSDYATKEIYKARRYGRSFSLLTFSIENLTQLKSRVGHSAVRQVQQIILRVLSHILRDADVVARASEHEFHVLLPETDYFGGLMFLRRALSAISEEPDARALEARVPMELTGGSATFPRDGDDFDNLLYTCRRRRDERRSSLHQLLKLEPLSFWDEVELLLGSAKSPKLPSAQGEPSRRGKVSLGLFGELQSEIARELLRTPSARGLVYLGGPQISTALPLLRLLEDAPADFAPRVYALGRRNEIIDHPVATPVFLEGDDRMARHEFVLWLGDGSAYVLLQRPGKGTHWGFHSSDPTLIEGLISKLQTEYDLQPY